MYIQDFGKIFEQLAVQLDVLQFPVVLGCILLLSAPDHGYLQ